MHRSFLFGTVALALSTTAFAQSLVAIDSSRVLSRIDRTTGAKTPFRTVTSNASTTAGLAYDFVNNVLYLTSTGNDSVFTLDVNTGTATLIGAYGDSTIVMHGLEYDLSTGTLYGASGSTNNNFYSINTSTGAATLIGPTGLTSFNNLCYHVPSDTMYLTNSGTDSWYTVDRTTGAATLVGALGAGVSNPNGLAYDLTTDTIYMVDNSQDNLYTIDRLTGAATLIGSTGSGNLLGLVILPPTGTYTIFGSGCAGTLGVPGNVPITTANVGSVMSVNLTNLPFDAALMMLGFSNTFSTAFGPLPLDLAIAGAPGCFGRVDPEQVTFLLGAGGTVTFNLSIPDVPSVFVGFEFFTQGLVFDNSNPFGFTTSDAASVVIGL